MCCAEALRVERMLIQGDGRRAGGETVSPEEKIRHSANHCVGLCLGSITYQLGNLK